MTLAITTAHNEARLEGTRAYLDEGTANAYIAFYDGTKPANPTLPTSSTPLLVISLAKPCGVVSGGVLTLAQFDPTNGDLVAVTGSPTWARLFNGNGDVAGDGTVSDNTGSGDFKIAGTSGTNLYAGGTGLLGTTTIG